VSARSGRLYELVGAGMAGWSRAVHRGVAVGIERLRLEPGVVLASTHPSDADPPVVAGALYRDGRLWRHPERVRPAFAVRNDLLLPGFFAGYPPWMPAWARRALYPVGIGPILAGQLLCLPVRFSDRLRLVEALRACPDAELAAVLPPARAAALAARARDRGLPLPRRARDVLRGEYADLLWAVVDRDELADPAFTAMWAQHAARSMGDLRALGEHLRGGGTLVIFPHGFPAPAGGIPPLDPRAGRLLHAMRPRALQPLAVVYDPLAGRRERAFLGIGEAIAPPPRRDAARYVLTALRRAAPLTGGLVVADLALHGDGGAPSATAALDAIARGLQEARATGRPVEPALRDDAGRRARVERALARLDALGLRHPAVARAARTRADALEPAP
jgi:hypothetical protein